MGFYVLLHVRLRGLATTFVAAMIAACGLALQAAEATKTGGAEAEEGFISLLGDDARKTWVGYGKDSWPDGWELADGVLHQAASAGDLRTVKQHGDFDLRFEWKISPGGNSGVIYRASQEKEPGYRTGPEYQILDDAKHGDGKSPLTSAGALYGLYGPAKKAARPAGQWNTGRIVVRNNRVRHFVNDEKVVDCQLGNDDWTKRVAASKFAQWKKFGKNKRGHIVLQDHGNEVWYRNMRIKDLE